MSKIKNIQKYLPSTRSLVWGAISMCIIVALISAVHYHKSSHLGAVYIQVSKVSESRSLLTNEKIADLLTEIVPKDLSRTEIAALNLKLIEETLDNDSRVKKVEVYINGENNLMIEVEPRQPAVRIKNKNGEDYYIDKDGNRIATVDNIAVRVPVISGYLSNYNAEWRDVKSHDMHDIYKIANVLSEDDLMKALIEQVHFDNEGHITFIPKIGRERITIGTTDFLDEKVENLKKSYKIIMKQKGWNTFKEMNFNYPNQIVLNNG